MLCCSCHSSGKISKGDFLQDPFEALKRNVNEAGKQLDDEEKKILVDELPLAMAHAVQLWESLAQSS